MKNATVRVAVVAGAVTASAALACGVAGAAANNKSQDYTSAAKSAAGLDVPSVVSIASTSSKSDTSKDGASSNSSSNSSAHTLRLADQDIGGVATCDSTGVEQSGVQKESNEGGPLGQPETFTISPDGVPVSITLLSARCESRAVQSNNASSSASAAVVAASVTDVDVVVLGSSSSSKTTSGQAGSGQTQSSFTVVEAADVTVVGCASQSHTTKGQATESSSFTVLDQQVDGPCPLTSADSSFAPTQ